MSKSESKNNLQNRARREFAKTLAVAAATPLIPAGSKTHVQEPSSARPAPPQAQPPDQPSPVAAALAEVARIRYGKYLDEEQLNNVKRSINRTLNSADRLKQFKLQNGDEPAFAFSADLPQ